MVADVSTPQGQALLLQACPSPDILINNNGGPPFRDFRQLDRQAMLDGVTMNMITPIELTQRVIDAMAMGMPHSAATRAACSSASHSAVSLAPSPTSRTG